MGTVTDLKSTLVYKKIEKEIEVFVAEKLDGYKPSDVGKKIIHDSVWGTVEYSEWEMQLIDSPLLQRLRDINQVGLALFTYSSARHSRFEHSLGVVAATKRMCERICSNSNGFEMNNDEKNLVYLAALLHDVGHCFFSHLSERIYGEFDDFLALRDEFLSKLSRKPKPHEMLSFIIINTKTFGNFFFNDINYPNKNDHRAELFHDVGRMIVGADIETSDRNNRYLTDIINGPFDADKLDYIKRDSLTAGLSLWIVFKRSYPRQRQCKFISNRQFCSA